MSAYTKLLMLVFITILLVLPMIIKGPDGRPIMTLEDWIPDWHIAPASSNLAVSNGSDGLEISDGAQSGSLLPANKMYKWQDERGRWHYSNEKPKAGVSATVEDLPQVENVIDAPVTQGDNSSTIRLPGGLL